MDKASISRLNALYILLTLKQYSNSNHPMSIKEITERANALFYHTHSDESSINSSTVSRILDTLCTDVNLGFQNIPMDYFNDISNLGFNIYCVMKMANGEWGYYKSPDSGKGPKKFYYYESIFTNAELTTLISAVETCNYFSSEDISGLVGKLLGLRPNSEYLKNHNGSIASRFKNPDSLLLANIDEFNRIIRSKQFAEIVYCSYDYHLNLQPREKYPRIVRPLTITWNNGYYYLVTLFSSGYTPANLRLDRITHIVAIEPTPEMLKEYATDLNFDATSYRLDHPAMYGGRVEHTSLLYWDSPSSNMNNAMLDTFGKLSKIRPATKEEIKQHIGSYQPSDASTGNWRWADVQSSSGGAEVFATRYCRYCKIISPEHLQNKVLENLETGRGYYHTS